MFISIVMPSHFRPALIKKCLDTLAAQTYPHSKIELIIVPSENDSGTEVMEDYKDRLVFPVTIAPIPNDPHRGKSASAKRNYGVSLAKGDWIAFIDDDCLADPNWILEASKYFESEYAGIEGLTKIEEISPPTLTWKGQQRLSNANGYQTCNMFYKKSAFLEVGGFDLNFPFYLEDTDLGWSVLDNGHNIIFCQSAIINHPTTDPEPHRLISMAVRTKLLVYLYKKHPDRYKSSKMEAFRKSYWVYLTVEVILLFSLLLGFWKTAILSGLLLIFLLFVHMIKLFWGCSFTLTELVQTFCFTPLLPPISFVQLIRGMIRYKTILPKMF